MSVRIRVSYTESWELSHILKKLSPEVKSWKGKSKKGRYNLAYIDMKSCFSPSVLVNKNGSEPAKNEGK